MAKEDATGQAVEPSMEQLLDINRKQSEIISAQARTIEELRGIAGSSLVRAIY